LLILALSIAGADSQAPESGEDAVPEEWPEPLYRMEIVKSATAVDPETRLTAFQRSVVDYLRRMKRSKSEVAKLVNMYICLDRLPGCSEKRGGKQALEMERETVLAIISLEITLISDQTRSCILSGKGFSNKEVASRLILTGAAEQLLHDAGEAGVSLPDASDSEELNRYERRLIGALDGLLGLRFEDEPGFRRMFYVSRGLNYRRVAHGCGLSERAEEISLLSHRYSH
jgi:hypothetical protein